MSFIPAELIKKKRRGDAHSPEEIRYLIQEYSKGSLPDYQMSAWLMAVCFRGMDVKETALLTEEMKNSGTTLNFKDLPVRVDKHSSGGVGDKISLILAPLVASFGVPVPMLGGRGLGHTGGTLDKLESIPGFRVNLSRAEFESHVRRHHLGLMGQTADICPADRKIYSLRDVTGTVESLPLICSSIMSKKLAEDLTGLVLDVKFGSGAFMKTKDEARALARLLKDTGEKHGVKTTAFLTNMNQPLGRFAGNALEVRECLEIMGGKTCFENGHDFYSDTRELTLILGAEMLVLAGLYSEAAKARRACEEALGEGRALKKFMDLCEYQGPSRPQELPESLKTREVLSEKDGWVAALQTERLGLALIELRAGRKQSDDKIDYSAGLEFHIKVGHRVKKGQRLFTVHYSEEGHFAEAIKLIAPAIAFSEKPVAPEPLIGDRI